MSHDDAKMHENSLKSGREKEKENDLLINILESIVSKDMSDLDDAVIAKKTSMEFFVRLVKIRLAADQLLKLLK